MKWLPLCLVRVGSTSDRWMPIDEADRARGLRANTVVWLCQPTAEEREVVLKTMSWLPEEERNEVGLKP